MACCDMVWYSRRDDSEYECESVVIKLSILPGRVLMESVLLLLSPGRIRRWYAVENLIFVMDGQR